MEDVSQEFLSFLLEFYKKYPEFKTRSLYITGESYAGKYIPLFANDILKHDSFKIALRSVLIGNPLNSPPI